MNSRHLLILGLVFVAFLALNVFQRASENKTTGVLPQHEEWRPLIQSDKAQKISFSKADGKKVVLFHEGEAWKVQSLSGVNADIQKINMIFAVLNGVKAELRAEGEALYGRFGTADNQAFRLQIEDAEKNMLMDFYIGTKRAGQGVFIRLAEKEKIYFVADDLPSLFGLFGDLEASQPAPIFFADLRLVPESFEQIQRFEVAEYQNGKKIQLAVLERPASGAGTPWGFVAGRGSFLPGFEKIENYLGRLIGAHAENIFEGESNFKTETEIMLRDERGKVLRLEFSQAPSESDAAPRRWLVRREKDATIFEISDWVFEDLKTDDAQLVEENPFHIQIDETYSVELKEAEKTDLFSKSSGWPSAAAILDAVTRLKFLKMDSSITAKDLAILPPTEQVKILRLDVPVAQLGFYVASPEQQEIRMVVSGQDTVYFVSRRFFESIFVPTDAVPSGGVSELTPPDGTASSI